MCAMRARGERGNIPAEICTGKLSSVFCSPCLRVVRLEEGVCECVCVCLEGGGWQLCASFQNGSVMTSNLSQVTVDTCLFSVIIEPFEMGGMLILVGKQAQK